MKVHVVDVIYVTRTAKAVCVKEHEDADEVWFPEATCEIGPATPGGELTRGRPAILTAEEWILQEKGLI